MNASRADGTTAAKLEAAAVALGRRYVEAFRICNPGVDAEVIEIGGGIATYVGMVSPWNHATGFGLGGPVAEGLIDRIEEMYLRRGVPPAFEVCPLADAGFVRELSRRGYRTDHFINVWFLDIPHGVKWPASEPVAPSPRPVSPDEQEAWHDASSTGFADAPYDMRALSAPYFEDEGILLYATRLDGRMAASGGMARHENTAWLFGTSVLPEFRRRGAHTAMIRTRLEDAITMGCTMATIETAPGSDSQRNVERFGFRLAFTRATMIRPAD